MATDFTIVTAETHHFGNEQGVFSDVNPTITFVGQKRDFTFPCANVNPGETAFLMFQSRNVDNQRNIFRVNGIDIDGGLPKSPKDTWSGNIVLISSRHRLKGTNNILHVESRNGSGGSSSEIDDFLIDNVVIVYKTR